MASATPRDVGKLKMLAQMRLSVFVMVGAASAGRRVWEEKGSIDRYIDNTISAQDRPTGQRRRRGTMANVRRVDSMTTWARLEMRANGDDGMCYRDAYGQGRTHTRRQFKLGLNACMAGSSTAG